MLMATDEPPTCVISLSQELPLRRLPFHGQAEPEFPVSSSGDDEPADFPVAFTPIAIESLPESPQQEGGNEGAAFDGLFETPPEDFASTDGSQAGDRGTKMVPNDVDSHSTDSPVATDLVFPEEADLQATKPGSSKSQKSRVSKREISPENGDSASKRSKSTFLESASEDTASQGMQPGREELGPNHGGESETGGKLYSSAETVGFETEVMKNHCGGGEGNSGGGKTNANAMEIDNADEDEGANGEGKRSAADAHFTENVRDAGAVPVTARGEVVTGIRNTADAGGGVTDVGVGAAAGGDAGGRQAGKKSKRNLKHELLSMIEAVMRITQNPEWGVKFPKPTEKEF